MKSARKRAPKARPEFARGEARGRGSAGAVGIGAAFGVGAAGRSAEEAMRARQKLANLPMLQALHELCAEGRGFGTVEAAHHAVLAKLGIGGSGSSAGFSYNAFCNQLRRAYPGRTPKQAMLAFIKENKP